MKRCLLPGLLSVVALACVPTHTGRLESNRFQNERYPYAIFYETGGTAEAPLGAGFRVDPRSIDGSDRGEAKNGEGRYTLNRVYDLDADGRGDFQRLEPRYDILLEGQGQDAALWVATFPLAERESGAALDALAQRYVQAMAGQGELAPSFGPESTQPASAGAGAYQVGEARPCQQSKREALRLDASFTKQGQARSTSVVVIRTGYTQRVDDGTNRKGRYPIFMVLGIMAHADKRAALEPRFESLLTHTVLGDRGLGLSMNGDTTCGSTPAPVSGGDVAAPPVQPESPEQQLQPMPSD